MKVPPIQGRGGVRTALWCLLCLAPLTAEAQTFDPAAEPRVAAMVERLADAGVDRAWLDDAMEGAVYRQSVLDAMSGAAEHHLTWHKYRGIFLGQERINEGAAFIETHRDAFDRAEARFGVPPEIIAAIIGVETRYGRITGDHRVLDSLSTLAFHHPRRGDFFLGELEAFLEIAYEQHVAPGDLKGSYAGAMGYPQFIPTSYQAYAVDFNDDGQRNLWTDPVDAIGSVANYFAEHRWQPGGPIYWDAEGPATPPSGIDFNRADRPDVSVAQLAAAGIRPHDPLDAERKVVPLALEMGDGSYRYRFGANNFYVITRYNHSYLYAMAVTELAEAIGEVRDLGNGGWYDATATETAP
ncbi:lytic murein transglycosylase B [Halomonas sp. V046]|uniref:lytic murein transglycosylase B n=1 Tax=Halomonas sp. V046 TaxID=3459611 RepID=UPI004044C8BB